MQETAARAGWRGVIEEYRRFLPVSEQTPVITMLEGGTPLIEAPRLSERVGARVWLKLEGMNPTCSFKDRGMTMAISKALEDGYRAVICASTGNTSASAAAYAAKAGITCDRADPRGQDRHGQARPGARLRRPRASDRRQLRRRPRHRARGSANLPIALVNSVNPYRIEGQKTGAFEICDVLGDAPDSTASRSATPATSPATGRATASIWRRASTILPRDARLPGRRRGAARARPPGRAPETIATAIRIGNPASWKGAEEAISASSGAVNIVTDEEILAAQSLLATSEGVYCEPASAASVSGLLKFGVPEGSKVVCILTGHGLKDPDITIKSVPKPPVVDADYAAVCSALGL
jgi:threonine synthase